jgi:broad specificity phosphatase PhoE
MYSKLLPVALLALSTLASAKPTVYLIRHGEKPDNDGTGLSAQGEQRAQCLRQVFGANSGYNIGYIMAMTPKDSASPLLVLHSLSTTGRLLI